MADAIVVIFSFDTQSSPRYPPSALEKGLKASSAIEAASEGIRFVESSIVVVERSGNVGEVLRAAFRWRGLHVYEASRTDTGLKLARKVHPDVIVLDVDEQSLDAESLDDALCRSSESTPIILLGTLRRPVISQSQCLNKPYHYSVLVSRIEQMLKARADGIGRAA
jgi:DNA-binding response OmpR family regulator